MRLPLRTAKDEASNLAHPLLLWLRVVQDPWLYSRLIVTEATLLC